MARFIGRRGEENIKIGGDNASRHSKIFKRFYALRGHAPRWVGELSWNEAPFLCFSGVGLGMHVPEAFGSLELWVVLHLSMSGVRSQQQQQQVVLQQGPGEKQTPEPR